MVLCLWSQHLAGWGQRTGIEGSVKVDILRDWQSACLIRIKPWCSMYLVHDYEYHRPSEYNLQTQIPSKGWQWRVWQHHSNITSWCGWETSISFSQSCPPPRFNHSWTKINQSMRKLVFILSKSYLTRPFYLPGFSSPHTKLQVKGVVLWSSMTTAISELNILSGFF